MNTHLTLHLKFNSSNADRHGQVQHRVMNGDQVIGILYDNREADHADDFVFSPYAARVAGSFLASDRDREAYLHRAEGVRGDDLHAVLAMIREWVNAVIQWREVHEAAFMAVLDALPALDYRVNAEKVDGEATGLRVKALGPHGSFETHLSWDNVAKVLGYSHSELQGWQITDFGVHEPYGYKWTYQRDSDRINVVSFSGCHIFDARRSEHHQTMSAA